MAGQNSPCSPAYFEYRSCSGSREWCGFSTFVPVSPPTKYRTKTQQDTAQRYTISAYLPYNGSSAGNGLTLSAPGRITFSASGTTTNWIVECHFSGSWPGSISVWSPNDLVFDIDYPVSAYVYNSTPSQGANAGIHYEPLIVGSSTISCTEDCNWSTNSSAPFLNDSALAPIAQSRTPTALVFTNHLSWTPATRTYTLTDEYKRMAVENKIVADLAACPTNVWARIPQSAESSLNGSTVTLRKLGYQIKLPMTEADMVYSLSWIVKYSNDDESPAGEFKENRTVIGTGFEVTTG